MIARILLLLLIGFAAWSQIPKQLTLEEAEQLALTNHPAIGAARFTALAESEVPKQYRAAFYPTATASLTGAGAPENTRLAAGGLNNPVIYSRVASGVSVNQMLLDFGRTSHLVGSAKLRAASSEYQADSERDRVLFEVRSAYLNALRAAALVRVAEATVEARQLVVDQVTELERERLKSGLDLSFAAVSLQEAKLLVASAENQRRAAHSALAVAIGRPNAEFELVEVPFRLEPLSITELVRNAIERRPDLKARMSDIEAAQEFVRAERALKYPSISATASAGWIPERSGTLRGNYSAVGLNVSLPFLNGGLYKAREAEAAMRERAAAERERALRNEIVREVTQAYLNANTAAERVNLTAKLLEQARQALDLAQARYDLGLSSIVELSQAQLAETSAAIQQTEARYEYMIQNAALQYRTGAQ